MCSFIFQIDCGIDWTLNDVYQFIEALIELTLSNDIKELKYLLILECVWKEMEKKLKKSQESLKNFWNYRLHMQLFCTQPIYITDIKIKLIE